MQDICHLIDLQELDHRIGDLPALPAVVLELLSAMGDAQMSLEVLGSKIGHDQVMTARVLRLANSSFYGMTGRISQISEAIAILGLRTVRAVALGARLRSALPADDLQNLAAFWRHTMATALFARELAPRFAADEDTAFTAGLLHDLGQLALASCFPGPWSQVLAYQASERVPTLQAERAVLGIDHQQAGAALARYWHFAPEMAQVMAQHHLPDPQAPRSLSALVHLSNELAHALCPAVTEPGAVPALATHEHQVSDMPPAEAARLFEHVERELQALSEALGL